MYLHFLFGICISFGSQIFERGPRLYCHKGHHVYMLKQTNTVTTVFSIMCTYVLLFQKKLCMISLENVQLNKV